jgi:hypothetical protein
MAFTEKDVDVFFRKMNVSCGSFNQDFVFHGIFLSFPTGLPPFFWIIENVIDLLLYF